jgi:hypothetical protein
LNIYGNHRVKLVNVFSVDFHVVYALKIGGKSNSFQLIPQDLSVWIYRVIVIGLGSNKG